MLSGIFLTNQRFFCPAHDKRFRDSNLNSFTPETLENHYVCTTSNVISLNVLENRTLMYKLVQEKEIFPSIAK